MTELEWLACREPDLMLDEIEGEMSREQLVEFVRQCCGRILRYLPPETSALTMVREFAALASRQSDHDAATYAYEAALKSARLAPDLREEQKHQADLLRTIIGIGNPAPPVRRAEEPEDSRSLPPS